MKITFFKICLLLCILNLAGCSKDKTDKEDIKKYDHSSLGKYSGVLVGSTGYINIDLMETGGKVTITIDNTNYDLSSTVPISPGTKITGYTMQNGQVKIVLNINADGSVPQVEVIIPGHNITAIIYKITSTEAVVNYLGTYKLTPDVTKPDDWASWNFNLTTKGTQATAILGHGCVQHGTAECPSDDDTNTAYGVITRTGEDFIIVFNEDAESATYNFKKTATGYKHTENFLGGEILVELKRVP